MSVRVQRPWLALAATLALAAGCEEPRNVNGKGAKATPAPKEQDNFIVGKKTQDIRKLTPEERAKGHAANLAITAKDPITLSGNAYVTSIGRLSVLQIEHAMNLYQAANDRYPKDYDEFMNEIIKANNIALPKLPPYQEYAYDEKGHKLVVWEYPDRKQNLAPGQVAPPGQ